MKKNISIQIKAALLLIVFSSNMVIGCACTVGINMGFNKYQHHDETIEVSVHKHAGEKKHLRHESERRQLNCHHSSNEGKDNCCNDKVVKITQTDKAVPRSSSGLNPFSFSIILSFYHTNILSSSQHTTSTKYFVRSHHPPIPDIRIAIQSFQI